MPQEESRSLQGREDVNYLDRALENLFGLVKQVNDHHDTVTVVTKTGENAVLVSE